MTYRPSHLETIRDLHKRQDDLLSRLDDLDQQVEQTLRAWQSSGQAVDSDGQPSAAATD
jgi:hypothetical protein